MTDEMIALARRAVACRGWRWMRGMSNDQGETIDCVDLIQGKAYCGEWDADMNALPDLTDPATLGCLLALVREAHDSPGLVACLMDIPHEWMILLAKGHVVATTESEALVAALEAAPCGR